MAPAICSLSVHVRSLSLSPLQFLPGPMEEHGRRKRVQAGGGADAWRGPQPSAPLHRSTKHRR